MNWAVHRQGNGPGQGNGSIGKLRKPSHLTIGVRRHKTSAYAPRSIMTWGRAFQFFAGDFEEDFVPFPVGVDVSETCLIQ